MRKGDLRGKLRLGYVVFGALLVIEVVEYLLGTTVTRGNWPFLAIFALIGAWPIVNYFMHLMQLRHPEE